MIDTCGMEYRIYSPEHIYSSMSGHNHSRDMGYADTESVDDMVRKSASKKSRGSKRRNGKKEAEKFVAPQSNAIVTLTFYRLVNCLKPFFTECRRVDLGLAYQALKKSLWYLFMDRDTCSKGVVYLLIGLAVSFISEMMNQGPQYNTVVLIVVIASMAFPHFPAKSVRPHVLITLLVTLSFLLDVYFCAHPRRLISDSYKGTTAIVAIMKLLALYNMLWHSRAARRARKYIHRRVRIFCIPCGRPTKVMREARARVLAAAALQLIATVGYVALLIAGFATISFSKIMTSPAHGIPLAAFYPIKILSSSLVLYGIYTDTDIWLFLSYFGCLGCDMKFVKKYIREKRKEYGGWPLAYGLNPYRFYVLMCVKAMDFLWSIGGWVTLSSTFGTKFYHENTAIIAMVSSSVLVMLLSDVWVPILFYIIWDLINYYYYKLEVYENTYVESDDSELDEMGIRRNKKKDIAARLQALKEEVKSQRYADYDDDHFFRRTGVDGVTEEEVTLLMGDYHRHHLPLPPGVKKAARWVATAEARQERRKVIFPSDNRDNGGGDDTIDYSNLVSSGGESSLRSSDATASFPGGSISRVQFV